LFFSARNFWHLVVEQTIVSPILDHRTESTNWQTSTTAALPEQAAQFVFALDARVVAGILCCAPTLPTVEPPFLLDAVAVGLVTRLLARLIVVAIVFVILVVIAAIDVDVVFVF
jgi:hypothetical protein